MYHKKPDKPDKSLAKWVEEKNSKATPKRSGFWHESKYRPPEDDIKEAEIKQDEPELIIPIPKSVVPSIEDYESTFLHKEDQESMQNKTLVSKLTDERQHLQDDLLKIDNKIINPLGVSDYQVKLWKIQRNAVKEAEHLVKYNTSNKVVDMIKFVAFKQKAGMMPQEYIEKYGDSWKD